MAIKINDLVVFNTYEVFKSLKKSNYEKYCVKDFKEAAFVVIRGPYEKVFKDVILTHIKIVVDIMRGGQIIEAVPQKFLTRI